MVRPRWDHHSKLLVKSVKNPFNLAIWKVTEDDCLEDRELAHPETIWDIAISPDQKYLVVGWGTEFVTIWNYLTLEKIIERRGSSFVHITKSSFETVFTKDSKYFAVKTSQGVIVYKSEDQEMLGVFPQKDLVFSISFSDDG